MTDNNTLKAVLQRAGRLLARRSYSREALKRKLAERADPGVVSEVLQRLEEHGLLNDAQYAYNLASRLIGREGWGPARVRDRLLRHGVDREVTESALQLARRDIDEDGALEAYVRFHTRRTGLPEDGNGIRRLFQHLQRRGYQGELIWRTLRRMISPEAWSTLDAGE